MEFDEEITDDMLVKVVHRPGGVCRAYRLPNGYWLTAVNFLKLKQKYAWEFGVHLPSDDDADAGDITYDTPLTSDVEVVKTNKEANEFIRKAKAWALKSLN